MNNKRRQQQISILIRLIALLICIIYLIITGFNSDEPEAESRGGVESETSTGLAKFENGSMEGISDTVFLEGRSRAVSKDTQETRNQWVADRYNEKLEDIQKYNNFPSIELVVDGIEFPKYMTGKDLQRIGGKSKIRHEMIYPFGELYGDNVDIGSTQIICSYVNINTEYADMDYSYIASMELNDNFKLNIESIDSAQYGDSLADILKSLEEFNIQSYSEVVQDTSEQAINVVYEDYDKWLVEISNAEENEVGIMTVKYTLSGDMNNGLKNVKYDLDIMTMDSLYDVYDKLYL